jgi:hypothetical protein
MALLYADEDFHYGVVERLRLLGHDVLTVQEAGRNGSSDAQTLADATAVGRAIVTFNRWHFGRLQRASPVHAGIVTCTRDPDLDALADRIHQGILAAGTLASQLVRIVRPP